MQLLRNTALHISIFRYKLFVYTVYQYPDVAYQLC